MNATTRTTFLAVSLMASAGFAWAESGEITGKWRDTQTGGITQVYSCGAGICVKVVRPSKGREIDAHNPNPQLKGRSMAGVVIMQGATKAGESRWKGKLYNPEDGEYYSGSISLVSKNSAKLEGCVLGGLICKARTWVRAE